MEIEYKIKDRQKMYDAFEKYVEQIDCDDKYESRKTFRGMINKNEFRIWYIGKDRKNSFNPIIYGELKDEILYIQLRVHWLIKLFTVFYCGILVCINMILLSSLIDKVTQNKIVGIIIASVLLLSCFLLEKIAFNIDMKEIKNNLNLMFKKNED